MFLESLFLSNFFSKFWNASRINWVLWLWRKNLFGYLSCVFSRCMTSRGTCRMAARWLCLLYLKTNATASSNPWSSTSWTLWTPNYRGQKARVLTMASSSPFNFLQVRKDLQNASCESRVGLSNNFVFSVGEGVSNEARFVFTVQSIVMPQKLKGTLTFIVKVGINIHTNSAVSINKTEAL